MKLISRITLAGLLVLSVILTVSCATASSDIEIAEQVNNSSVPASAIETPEVDTSKKEIIPETVQETIPDATEEIIPEVIQEEKPETTDDFEFVYSYKYQGYEITAQVHNGYGYVSYPAFITDGEIETALKAFTAVYGNYGVTYKISEPGKLKVSFPKGLNKADFDYVALIVNEELTWYLNEMFKTPKVETSEVKEPVITEKSAVAIVEKEQPSVEKAVEIAQPATVEKEQPSIEKTVEIAQPATKVSVETEPSKAEPSKAETAQAPVTAEKGKTGVSSVLIIAIIVVVLVALGFVIFKKKKN